MIKPRAVITWRLLYTAISLGCFSISTVSCHSISHDALPQSWHIQETTSSSCADITGIYQETSNEETSQCYKGRRDYEFICTTSLSHALLGSRVSMRPIPTTHVEIQQRDSHELAIKLWSDEVLLQKVTLSSEGPDYKCTDNGVRISWRDNLVIAPPFVSLADYESGTFQRATDGALIMKRDQSHVVLMWGFIPWLTDIRAEWVRWPPYNVNNTYRYDNEPVKKIFHPQPGEATIYFYQDSVGDAESCRDEVTLRSGRMDLGRATVHRYSIIFAGAGLFEFFVNNDAWDRVELEGGKNYFIRARWEMPGRHCLLSTSLVPEAEGRAAINERSLMDISRYPASARPHKPPETELQKYYNDPDDKDATTWLCRAADAGNPEAQYRLGLLYEYGTGNFPKDPIKAYMWYRISESTGGYMRPADQAERILADIPPEQASKADQLVRDWKPGQCEKELTPSKADH